MKRKENALNDIILNDRLKLSKDTSEMICYDAYNLLSEYFNLDGGVNISVEAEKDCYKVTVTATAVAIKSFGIIK
ncbi:MAG: hypothetical protein IJA97_06755 [Clostridia bacterium]|nr:hypothetical protein [Clostridia bacterium]